MRSYVTKAALVATLMAMAPSAVLAQTGFLGHKNGNVSGGLGVVVAPSPGNYQFKQLDQTTLNEQILARLDQSRTNDRLFLMQHFQEINDAFKDVSNGEYKDLQDLGLRSTQSPVTYFEYYSKTQAYFRKRLEIKQLIESIVQLPDVLKTSANSAATGDATVTLQGQLQLDLGKLVKPMNDQLAILDNAAQGITFNLTLPNGVVQQVTNINADGIDKSNLISQKYLNDLTLDIARSKAQVLDQQTQRIISNINRQTMTLVQHFINNQGMTQQWRVFKPTDQFSNSELSDLNEAFWLRSFVRAKYGIPVGAIGIKFKLKALNLDQQFSSVNMDPQMINTLAGGQAELNDYGNMMRSAITAYDHQANLGGNPLNLIAWTITRVQGKWNQANANVVIVKLLAADLLEEQMILKGGGLRAMHDHYKGRYGANPVMKQTYKKLQCNYDGGCSTDDGFNDIGIANDTSMRGIYATEKPVLDNMLVRQEIADRKQSAYADLVKSFGTIQNSNKRSNNMLD